MLGKTIKIIAIAINPDVIGLAKIKLAPSYNCIDLEKLSSNILPKIKPINKGANGYSANFKIVAHTPKPTKIKSSVELFCPM